MRFEIVLYRRFSIRQVISVSYNKFTSICFALPTLVGNSLGIDIKIFVKFIHSLQKWYPLLPQRRYVLVDVGRKVLQEGEDCGAATAAERHGRHDEQPGQEGVRALHEVELGVVDRKVGRGFVGPLLHSDGILARDS